MNRFTQFDTWTINCTEKRLIHPMQRWTGLNNFDFMPWLFVFFLIISILPGIIFADFDACYLGAFFNFIFSLPLTLLFFFTVKPKAMLALKQGCANPEKINPANRLFGLFTLFFSLFVCFLTTRSGEDEFMTFALFWTTSSATLSVYFQSILVACDPLKPAKSKLKEFLESCVPQPELEPIRIHK